MQKFLIRFATPFVNRLATTLANFSPTNATRGHLHMLSDFRKCTNTSHSTRNRQTRQKLTQTHIVCNLFIRCCCRSRRCRHRCRCGRRCAVLVVAPHVRRFVRVFAKRTFAVGFQKIITLHVCRRRVAHRHFATFAEAGVQREQRGALDGGEHVLVARIDGLGVVFVGARVRTRDGQTAGRQRIQTAKS